MSNSQSETKITRRGFLRTQAALAAAAAAAPMPALAAATPTKSAAGVDYYEKLGVQTFINAAGTYTNLSSACMPEQVQEAVALAADSGHGACQQGSGCKLLHTCAFRQGGTGRLLRILHFCESRRFPHSRAKLSGEDEVYACETCFRVRKIGSVRRDERSRILLGQRSRLSSGFVVFS